MPATPVSGPLPSSLDDAEQTPPEVKQYERAKLRATVASLVLSIAALSVCAFLVGPRLGELVRGWVGDSRWLRLIVLSFCYAAGLELLTLPIDFWSGYVLEHRYQ